MSLENHLTWHSPSFLVCKMEIITSVNSVARIEWDMLPRDPALPGMGNVGHSPGMSSLFSAACLTPVHPQDTCQVTLPKNPLLPFIHCLHCSTRSANQLSFFLHFFPYSPQLESLQFPLECIHIFFSLIALISLATSQFFTFSKVTFNFTRSCLLVGRAS